MSLALVFPGQGTQHPEMLRWLEDRPAAAEQLAALERVIGADWRARLHDATWATCQDVAQPMLTMLSLAAWAVLEPLLPTPAAVAGYSVGELPAWCVAGVYGAAQALAMAQQRAQAMAEAGRRAPGGLMAVAGLVVEAQVPLLRTLHLEPAIVLSHDEAVLGGRREDLASAVAPLEAVGVRCTPLAVDVASHTSLLLPAVPAWREALQHHTFRRPRCPVVCNATAAVERDAEALREAAAQQIAHTVPWARCMDTLTERGIRCVLEMGPGATLSRLWTRHHPDVQARSIDEFKTPEHAAQWVQGVLARS